MSKKPFISSALASLLALGLWSGQANAAVVESFDSGNWGAGWSDLAAGTVNAGAAHDGGFGVTLDGGVFTINPSILMSPGDTLSAWIRPSSGSDGRVYLGFGANAGGTQSFVGATNTSNLIFQDNTAFDFTDLTSIGQSWANQWYLMEIFWSTADSATGNLYDSDGATLLNSLNVAGLPFGAGGISLRGFGGWDLDTISVASATAVPEPGSLALIALGLAGLGLRRRMKS